MAKDGQQAIKMLATINAEKSECWKAEDRDRIFDVVRRPVGFAGINAMVFEQLRGWVIQVTTSALGQETDKMKVLGLNSTLAVSTRIKASTTWPSRCTRNAWRRRKKCWAMTIPLRSRHVITYASFT